MTPRVLFLDHTAQMGGAEFHLLSLAPNFTDGCEVVLLQDGPLHDRLKESHVAVRVLEGDLSRITTQSGLVSALSSVKLLGSFVSDIARISKEFDIIYTNSAKATVIGTAAGRLANKPVIVRLHDIITSTLFSDVNRFAFLQAANLATCIAANSEASINSLTDLAGHDMKHRVIYDGFPLAAYEQLPLEQIVALKTSLGIDEDTPVIGCFSRIAPWKGQRVLLESLSHISGKVCLLLTGAPLFGEAEYWQTLQQLAQELPPEKQAIFTGFRDDLSQLMQVCDVMVLPSIQPEPFGRVVVEAQLVGVPVIATGAGGVMETVKHDVTGWLVPPNESEALAKRIQSCLENKQLRLAVADTARLQARKRFDIATMTSEFAQLFTEVKEKHV
jgi:glycosyltransferase involved in cell wall biosynthesis